MILVCDVGGTKIDIGFVSAIPAAAKFASPVSVMARQTFQAKDWSQFGQLLRQVIKEFGEQPEVISLAIAAPVAGVRRIKLTNLPWSIDLDQLATEFPSARFVVSNDLEAMAAGIAGLSTADTYVLQDGEAVQGNRCVIAAGTGLGEALLIWNGVSHLPVACEGGHADFAPANQQDLKLWSFAQARFGHVSWERLVSGVFGFGTIADFFLDQGAKPSKALAEALDKTGLDIGATLAKFAAQGDEFAISVIEKFISLYGAEAGNLALKAMARGGVYIGGGIAPKLIDWMKRPDLFMKAFCDKGRFSAFMAKIPVHVITGDSVILSGAALRGQPKLTT